MENVKYLPLFIALFTLGCTNNVISPIKLKTTNKDYEIVVEGGLNTFQKRQFIKLSKPAILPGMKVQPISQATVNISDGNNKVFFKETDTPGVYSGIINDNRNYNRAYTLNIDYNNNHYNASDTLRKVADIKDTDLPFSIQVLSDGKIQLKIPRHIFYSPVSLRWLLVYPQKNQWDPSIFKKVSYIYSHQLGSPNTLYPSIQKITTLILNPNDSVTVYKFSQSASYSTYLYNVFQETDFKNIFSSTPGRILGNVSNNGLGYFHATDVSVKQYLVRDFVK
jgi:hypothetical protein